MNYNEDNGKFYIFAGLMAILIIIVAVFVFVPRSGEFILKPEQNNNDQTVSVSGSAEKKVMPNEAYIYFTIETEASIAKDAQTQSAEIWAKIKSELDKLDYVKYSTENFNVWPNQEWDENSREYITNGYKVSHSVRITCTKIDETGALLDLVVKAGVNNVYSVSFGLSRDEETKVKDDLWKIAVDDAKTRAEAVAKAAGAELNTIPKNISLNDYSYNPYPLYYNTKEIAMDSTGSAPQTDVTPKELTVSVSLNLVYEYE